MRTKNKNIVYDEWGCIKTGWITVIAILIISLFFIGLITGVVAIANKSCVEVGKSMGIPSKYSIWTDCMLKVDNYWIREENYGEIIIRKER